MKKTIIAIAALLVSASIFAASYKNNTYQKLANEYTKKAEAAMDAGEYAESIEFAKKAEENAALSKAYIEMMTARTSSIIIKTGCRRMLVIIPLREFSKP